MVDALVTYDKGLDRWHGMLELAEEAGIFSKVSTRFELPDGSKMFGKQIMQQPEKYFTEDVMKKVDEFCKEKFLYGTKTVDEEMVQDSAESSE